jgi:hypothetical protein
MGRDLILKWQEFVGLCSSLFVWLVADGRCWIVLREKYYWLVADKPSEQAAKYPVNACRGWVILFIAPRALYHNPNIPTTI